MTSSGAAPGRFWRLAAGASPFFALALGFSGFLPPMSTGHRWAAAGVLVALLAVGSTGQFLVARSAKRSDRSRAMSLAASRDLSVERLLQVLAKTCCARGDWRVSIYREGLDTSGRQVFTRVKRLAFNPVFSTGGRDSFLRDDSVMRTIGNLATGDPNAPPVDLRINLPDPDKYIDTWRTAQREFVKDATDDLRMRSRAYGWRRVHVEGAGFGPHVLLVESTDPRGISRDGLTNVYVDAIVTAAVLAMKN